MGERQTQTVCVCEKERGEIKKNIVGKIYMERYMLIYMPIADPIALALS